MPGVRPPVHHGRDGQPDRGQALRRDRAVQPGEGARRRPQGVPGPAGRPRTTWRCWPSGSRRRSGPPASPRSTAHEVGLAVLGPLRELDEVAYLRFASVYRSFESLEDFEAEIALLRAEREPTASSRPPRQPRDRRGPAEPTAPLDQPTTPQRSTVGPEVQHVDCRPAEENRHDGDVAQTSPSRRGPGSGPRREGPHDRAHLHHAGVHPYDEVTWERRDVVMTNWRDGDDQLRAARGRVPRLLVGQRHQHRHHQVLPRRRRHRRPRVEPAAAHRPGRADLPEAPARSTATSPPERRRDLRARAHLGAAAPGVLVQLAGLVQRRHVRARSRSRPASSSPSTTRWTRS